MTGSKKIDQYIEKHSQWKNQLNELRAIFLQTELIEEVKWSAPAYTLNGSIVSGLGAFKNHYAIWFHQGVFLRDKKKNWLMHKKVKPKPYDNGNLQLKILLILNWY